MIAHAQNATNHIYRNKYRFLLLCSFLVGLLFVGKPTAIVRAFDHTAATVDGTVSSGEYVGNTYASGSQTWYMVWDDTDLYIGLDNANVSEKAVIYIDTDPQTPVNGGTNSNGTLVGFINDNTNFAELQFRADIVISVQDGSREFRTADGSGGWSSSTSGFGAYASSGSTREFSIPWSAMGGRPSAFNWFGYATSSGGFVYGQAPVENGSGSIGTTARWARYFTVIDTGATTSQNPFLYNSYVFNSTSDVGGFGAINVYDFTMNTNGRKITRADSGDWTIGNDLVIGAGTVQFTENANQGGSTSVQGDLTLLGGKLDQGATNQDIAINGDVDISSGAILELSTSTGDLTVGGDWSNVGTFTHNGSYVYLDGGGQSVSGTTTFQNLYHDSGGTKSYGTSSITIEGSFFANAGSMQADTSTFVFTGTGASIGGGSTKRFYDLVINLGANVTNTSGNIEINRDFTNNGSFTQSVSRMTTFETAGAHALSGTGSTQFGDVDIPGVADVDANMHDFSVVGDFTITGTFTGDSSTVTFNGSSAQTVGGSGTAVFNNLTLNNSSGLTLDGSGDHSLEGTLTLTDGRFDLADHHLTLGDAASVAGSPDASKMVVATCTGTSGEGELRKKFASASSFTFPIGDDDGTAEYSPVDLTFNSGTFDPDAYVSVCVVNAKQPNNNSSTDYLNRYWTIEQNGISSFSATPTFNYMQADVADTEANIFGAKYDGSWSLLSQVNEANNQFNGTVTSFSDFTGGEQAVVPVTMSYFQATSNGDNIYFNWQTATETANMGFNLYAQTGNGLQQLNQHLILSKEMSSLQATDYSFNADAGAGDIFYIEDIDVSGKTKRQGPFALGQTYGRKADEIPIDWAAINAEHNAKAAERNAAATQDAQARIQRAATNSSSGPLLTLGVSQTGLYRVTYADLLAAGIDLTGANLTDIALVQGGVPVPINVVGSGGLFDTDSYIEFYGQAIDTLYSKENIYSLHLDAALTSRANIDTTAPSGTAVATYQETLNLDENNKYDVVAPGESPWYDSLLMAYGGSTSKSFNVDVDNYVSGSGPVTLAVNMWGGSQLPPNPDHHVVVGFGGSTVADVTFDGLVVLPLEVGLADDLVQNGANTLQISLPDDTGAAWDIVAVDTYSLTYPRSFVAKADGQLTFTSSADSFQVDGLPGATVIVYRYEANSGSLTQITGVTVSGSQGNYSATFAGSGSEETYLVYSSEHLLTPVLKAARPYTDITSGTVDYLMIAHADFIAGLAPLVAFHESNGLLVKVVDVADVYDQFSDGIFDPQAIKDYIQHAEANMDVEYVLLVGGDTSDYFNFLGLDSVSFIPSPYMSTVSPVNFAPVDPLYVDVDGDLSPDMNLGRFPVRSDAELAAMIDKTLLYAAADYKETAVFSADILAERSFANISNEFAANLPASWSIETAYLDEQTVEDARSTLIDSINGGVGLTSYVGHSGLSHWTWEGLFNADDASTLSNVGKPTAVTQWGCWNTYHVLPQYNTLGHQFMQGESGAAVVLGATTLTHADSENLLGQAFMARVAQGGLTIGEVLQLAKADVQSSTPDLRDIQLGYTLLGDPALALSESPSCAPAATPTNVTITKGSSNVELSWDDMGAAVDHYEVWHSEPNDFYFTPGIDCEASANCTIVNGTMLALGNVTVNQAYMILAVNSCGAQSSTVDAKRIGVSNFAIQSGTAP